MFYLNAYSQKEDLVYKDSFWLKIDFGHCCEIARSYLKGFLIWCKVTSQQLILSSQESGKGNRSEAWENWGTRC